MFHFQVSLIKRSEGRSATAAAAYRSGSAIHDRRTNERHDYTRSRQVDYSDVVLPLHAPSWASDRERLWNAAELAEKRKDARVARSYDMAIPKDLGLAESVELVLDFARFLCTRYGVAVDLSIVKDAPTDVHGVAKAFTSYHATCLATTRKVEPCGLTDKASIELSSAARHRLGLTSSRVEVVVLRQAWEAVANEHLKRVGSEARIDHRSLVDQGSSSEPGVHLGGAATRSLRRKQSSRLDEINREIAVRQEAADVDGSIATVTDKLAGF